MLYVMLYVMLTMYIYISCKSAISWTIFRVDTDLRKFNMRKKIVAGDCIWYSSYTYACNSSDKF